jgi:protein TonB
MRIDDETAEPVRSPVLRWIGIAGGAILLAGGVVVVRTLNSGGSAPPRMQEVTMVKIVLPPAPPPPPPPPPPPEQRVAEEKMIEQTPVEQAEAKPEAKPEPSAGVGTSIKGDGAADGFGLSANGGNGGGAGSGNRSSGSRWGWYAAEVQTAIAAALRRDPLSRAADFRVRIRIWTTPEGRIERAVLSDSTGNPALDEALQTRVLNGLRLPEAPPTGMPMPIVLRLTAHRASPST